MGLIYLMYCSFERISLHKPITSRPANSERYIFCENLNTFGAGKVLKYLVEVNNRLNAMERKSEDTMELVPDELMQADDDFMQYIGANIEKIARRQIFYLHKYKHFAATPGTYDQDQIKLRNQALHYWELPDKKREEQEMRNRKRNWHQANYEEQKRPESVTDLFDRYSKKQVHFSSKRTEHFTAKVLEQCTDVAEFRALLLPEHVEPVLLISQGANRLLQRRRNGNNFEGFQEVNTTIPKETILLVQCTYLFELKEGKDARIDQVGKCLWVLDAAVLNGDDVSQLDLKARIAAARKFAAAVNRLQIRQNWKNRFSGQGCYNFSEMIVAEPKRLQALVDQQNFVVKNYKGSRMAFFPVWARNDRRDQPPQRYFVACRGVRVQNVLNPNFKLVCENNAETVMPRHAKIDSPNPCTNFYQAFQGYFPAEQLIASYPDGHPLGGAITFHWSWEPDYSSGLNVEDILHKDQHPAGLTLRAVRRLIEERQQKKRTNVAENLQRNNNNYQQQMLVAMKKEEDQEEDGQQSIPPKDAQDNNNRKRDPIGDGEEEEDTDAMGPMAKRRRTSTTEQSAGPE